MGEVICASVVTFLQLEDEFSSVLVISMLLLRPLLFLKGSYVQLQCVQILRLTQMVQVHNGQAFDYKKITSALFHDDFISSNII